MMTRYQNRAMTAAVGPTAPLRPCPPQPTLHELGWPADVAEHLRGEILALLRAMPPWRLSRVALVVRLDGVEVMARDDLRAHWRRHGLHPLAARLATVPIDRAALVLEGDEVAVLSVDAARWLEGSLR